DVVQLVAKPEHAAPPGRHCGLKEAEAGAAGLGLAPGLAPAHPAAGYQWDPERRAHLPAEGGVRGRLGPAEAVVKMQGGQTLAPLWPVRPEEKEERHRV